MAWERAEAIFPWMVDIRRTIHRYPELAFQEARTAQVIIAELERLGIPYRYDGVGSGVIGELNGAHGSGPAVALRADMDALPIHEATGLPFASEVPGRMHACGHDAHVTMVLGAAALLRADPPPGRVLFVFQPAEEQGNGAQVVMASGALDKVDAIFGGHVGHQYCTGEIMVEVGAITAQTDVFNIRIKGRGGHGARPHEATDAIVVAALLITAIQTLISRETNPFHPSVITIGKIVGGSAANVIAEDVLLEGTLRTTSPEGRRRIVSGLERMAKAAADLHNAKVEVDFQFGCPPVINSPRETELARAAAIKVVGEERLAPMEYPSMGGEDFSFYLEQLPGCYVRFGARQPDQPEIALHNAQFTVDEDVLKVGAMFFEQVARDTIRELTHSPS
jgi:hippurate hydrolase